MATETRDHAESDAAVDAPSAPTGDRDGAKTLVLDELLVEEISIDGMCGVY